MNRMSLAYILDNKHTYYYTKHKDTFLSKRREHYIKNKETIMKYRRDRYVRMQVREKNQKYAEEHFDQYKCKPCGYSSAFLTNYKRHEQGIRHQKRMNESSKNN